jgi:hypothetical protein
MAVDRNALQAYLRSAVNNVAARRIVSHENATFVSKHCDAGFDIDVLFSRQHVPTLNGRCTFERFSPARDVILMLQTHCSGVAAFIRTNKYTIRISPHMPPCCDDDELDSNIAFRYFTNVYGDESEWTHSFESEPDFGEVLSKVQELENIRECDACRSLFSDPELDVCPQCTLKRRTPKDIGRGDTCAICLEAVQGLVRCAQCTCVLHVSCRENMRGAQNCPVCKCARLL